jgi:hypothetical protein
LFVIGLKWKRLVTSSAGSADGIDSARKVASESKSSHMILDRDAAGKVRAVGHGSLGKKAPPKVLSLAAAFAGQFQQIDKAVIALELPRANAGDEPEIWICGVADGVVYQGTDVVVRKADVQEHVSKFTARFEDGSVEFYGDVIEHSQGASLDDLMARALSKEAECRLQRVGRSYAIPKPLRYALMGLATIFVLNLVRERYQAEQLAKQQQNDRASKVQDPSPQQAWEQAVASWIASSDVAPTSSLQDLLQTLGRLGLDVEHWKLESIDCKRKGPQWSCDALYKRDADWRADSLTFKGALPPGWLVAWKGVDDATVTFKVPCSAGRFDPKHAKTEEQIHLPLLSELQRFSKAFDRKDLGEFAAVQVPLPKHADGTAYVINPQVMKPIIVSAPLSVSGPLRSVFTLLDMPISFTELKLKVAGGAEPSLVKSALQVEELTGVIYAIQ